MGSCPACGARTEPGDRFCSACGDMLVGLGPIGAPDTGWASSGSPDEPELLLLEPPPAAPATGPPSTITPPRSPRWRLAAAAGLLVVAVALWAIGRGGSGPDDAGDTAGPASTTMSQPTAETDAAPTASDQAAATDDTADPDTVPVYDPASAVPVLGRPIGWSLLVGGSYATELERLDLDTGQRVRYDGVTGGPVAALDGRLVLEQRQDDGTVSLGIVPLDDPAAGGIELTVGNLVFRGGRSVAPATEGGLWVHTASTEGTSWRLVRARDGKLLDEVPTASAFLVPPVDGGGPEVATSPSGGLYRRHGASGFRLVSPGRPITVSQGAALVDICSLPIACDLAWVDLESGAPADRPLPTGDAGIGWVGSAGTSGRFLVGWRSGRLLYGGDMVLYDLVRGRVVETGVDLGVGSVAGTPDGRYLAVEAPIYIHIYDVEQDRWVAVHRTGDPSASLLFVPNGGG